MRVFAVLSCVLLMVPGTGPSAQTAPEDAATEVSADNQTIEEVTVQASRLQFGVDSFFEPEVSYDETAIRDFAVSTIAELLEEIGPEIESGRGRQSGSPVVLINAQRIGSFREVRSFPPEAIERVEVYPEEVALQYGFRAEQKVVNVVLKPSFQATTTRILSFGSTEGGAESGDLNAGFLRIQDSTRLNLDFTVRKHEPVHDTDRSVPNTPDTHPFSIPGNLYHDGLDTSGEIDPALSALAGEIVTSATLPEDIQNLTFNDLLSTANNPEAFDERSLRTLIAERDEQQLDVSYTFPLAGTASASLAAQYQQSDTRSEQGAVNVSYGVPAEHPNSPFSSDVLINTGFSLPLIRDTQTKELDLNGTLNGNWRGWTLNWTSSFGRTRRDITTDRGANIDAFVTTIESLSQDVNPFEIPAFDGIDIDRDRSDNQDLRTSLLISGVLAETAAGHINLSTTLGHAQIQRDSSSTTDATFNRSSLDRNLTEMRLSMDVPVLADERWGELSVNGNVERNHYNDFGHLNTFGGGITWRPNQALRLTSSWNREQGAPSIEQLSDPLSRTPNIRLFDFATATTTDTVLITGGNPNLKSDTRRVFSIGAQIEPFDRHNLSLNINYVDSKTDNPIMRFPRPSAELERAFPTRYVRGADGTLLAFDTRPINLDEEERQEVRWSLRYSRTLAERANGGTPRLRFALSHVYTLHDEATIAPGFEPIDYVGINNGTRQREGAEHVIHLRGVYSYRAFKARVVLNWRDALRSLPGSTRVLTYDDVVRVNLTLVYSPRRKSGWVQRFPGLQGTRMKLTINNLFNEKPNVRDQFGLTPAGLTEDELDPRGRTALLEIRKMFQ